MTTEQNLDLSVIASRLESLEETIINKLIDRIQFCVNSPIYQIGSSGFEDAENESLFDLRIRHQEEMDALFGRFCVPEERPFSGEIPRARRKITLPPTGLHLDNLNIINVTQDIKRAYLTLIPRICRPGEDGHFGSSVEHDVYILQAVARRIHFGSLYVAESKFRGEPQSYSRMIRDKDSEGLMRMLTRKEVEEKIIERVAEKVISIQALVNRKLRNILEPETVIDFYRETVIPLTKKGEVLYLLNRQV
jgi:chorismate mutase